MHVFAGREEAREPRENPYSARTCKLQTERPQQGFEPGTLFLCGDGANYQRQIKYRKTKNKSFAFTH